MGVLSDGDEQIIVTSVLSYFHEIECGIETLFDLRNYSLSCKSNLYILHKILRLKAMIIQM